MAGSNIQENLTRVNTTRDFPPGYLDTLRGRRIDPVEIHFNIDQIDNIEAIRQFFASNPELLPANFRERVFHPEAPPVGPRPRPQENNEPSNYKLLIGSLLAFAVISYVAIKILHEPPKAEVK